MDGVFALPFIDADDLRVDRQQRVQRPVWAAQHFWRGLRPPAWSGCTLLGGIAFFGMGVRMCGANQGRGDCRPNPWERSAVATYFFVTTGFHGAHVLTGVVVLLVVALGLGAGRTPTGNVEMAGLYWHFVDLVWVFIFTLFYLV